MKVWKFGTKSCEPCKALKPTIDRFLELHPRVDFREIDCEEESELADKLDVLSIPCVVFLTDDRKEILRIEGLATLAMYEKAWMKADYAETHCGKRPLVACAVKAKKIRAIAGFSGKVKGKGKGKKHAR